MTYVSYKTQRFQRVWLNTAKDRKRPTKDRKGALHMTKYRNGALPTDNN